MKKVSLLFTLIIIGHSTIMPNENSNPNTFEDWKANFRVSYTPAE